MGLYENTRAEPVRRLALRDPAVVGEGATVRDAVLAMRYKRLGCAIVLSRDGAPLGMLAESDLTRLLVERPSVIDDPIRDVMSRDWPTVSLADPISKVLEAMERENVRFLIVVDKNGQLAGLTGQKGLMEYVAEHFPGQAIVQRIGGNPFPIEREGA